MSPAALEEHLRPLYGPGGGPQALLRDGRTRVLDGFTARNGRTYKGHLEIDADEGKVKVVSEDCQIIETATHFTCQKRLKSEEIDAAFKAARRLAKEQRQPAPEKPAKPEHCGFVLPRTVCKREMTREECLEYMKIGRTELPEEDDPPQEGRGQHQGRRKAGSPKAPAPSPRQRTRLSAQAH